MMMSNKQNRNMPPIPKAAISGILHQCLMHWTCLSMLLCEKLAENGMVMYLTGELEFLQSSMEMNEHVVMCLEMSLYILVNCILTKNARPAFIFADSTTILISLTSCIHIGIRVKAKSILSFLNCYIGEKNLHVLKLDSEECDYIIKNLNDQIMNNTLDCVEVNKWLQVLINASKIKANEGLLSTSSVFQLTLDLLGKGAEFIQELILQFLWNIASSTKIKEIIHEKYSVIMSIVEKLQSQTNSDLQCLASCFLWHLRKSKPLDYLACLKYAKGCYMYGKYEECILWCEHVCQNVSDGTILNDMKLLKGKALYCSCVDNLRYYLKMKTTNNLELELPMFVKECLTKVKESILLLGVAYDHNILDEDGSKFLDWAMIDYIRETNKLDSCNRCLLCRSKVSLKRSHIYPRSVLKVIAQPNVSEGDHRIYLHKLKGKLSAKSAGEITYWMLCGTCEERLSQNGENEFCNQFFKPIFKASQEVMAGKEHCTPAHIASFDINYGKWLYNFCVGILFRGLGISVMPHCRNNDEVYDVFLKFRKIILSLPVKTKAKGLKEVPELNKLEVDHQLSGIRIVTLINPTFVTDEKKTFLPQTLLNSNIAALASVKLDDGQPTFALDAPFFLVRLGLINIFVEIMSTNEFTPKEKYFIKPEGGAYYVPSEDERWDSIPSGLWKVFETNSCDSQEANMEYLLKLAPDQRLLKYMDEEANKADTSSEDVQAISTKMSLENDIPIYKLNPNVLQQESYFSSRIINLLPKGFSFFDQMSCLTYNSVILPESHRILLHATDLDIGITVFLCAGAGGKFSPSTPYLISLVFQEQTTIIEGVTLTPNGSISDFMSDFERRSGSANPIRVQTMPIIQAAVEVILPNLLAENGFDNLEAVIYWTTCHWLLEEFPTIDLKCLNGCWYCSNLCNMCMKPSKVGLIKQVPGSCLLKFCSDRCLAVANEDDTDISFPISVARPPVQKCNTGLPSSNLLFHAEKVTSTYLAKKTIVKISLLMDKIETGVKLFALQQLRTINCQVVLGFSLTEELFIVEPLPSYVASESTKTSFDKAKQDDYTKVIIEDVLIILGFCDIQLFIENQATVC